MPSSTGANFLRRNPQESPRSSWGLERAGSLHALQPNADDFGNLNQAVRRAILRRIAQAVPMGIVEVDHVNRWNAGVLQRQVIVHHSVPLPVQKGAALQLRARAPQVDAQLARL